MNGFLDNSPSKHFYKTDKPVSSNLQLINEFSKYIYAELQAEI